jgi:hypothetical protein
MLRHSAPAHSFIALLCSAGALRRGRSPPRRSSTLRRWWRVWLATRAQGPRSPPADLVLLYCRCASQAFDTDAFPRRPDPIQHPCTRITSSSWLTGMSAPCVGSSSPVFSPPGPDRFAVPTARAPSSRKRSLGHGQCKAA